MRIARVQYESLPAPVVALERDGALYDVVELEAAWGSDGPATSVGAASDFATRVIALGLAGLDTLDERLRAGERPHVARLEPDGLVWLAPGDPERACWVHVAPTGEEAPRFRLESARMWMGHRGAVPLGRDGVVRASLGLAVLLGEAIEELSPRDVERAILGATGLVAWTTEGAAEGTLLSAQLGPVLVTPDELGPLEALQGELSADGARALGPILSGAPLGERLAFVAARVPLRAGDGVSFGGALAVAATHVRARVERIGRLEGHAFRGALPPPWRSASR